MSNLYIKKSKLTKIINEPESEVIYTVETKPEREAESLHKWLKRHVDADNRPRWLEPKTFDILLKSRQHSLRVIHAKKHDALIIEQRRYCSLPPETATLTEPLVEKLDYLIVVKGSSTMPFSGLENIKYDICHDNYRYISRGNIYQAELCGEDMYQLHPADSSSPQARRESIIIVAKNLQQLNPRLRSQKLSKYLDQPYVFGKKENWVQRQKVYFFSKFIAPFFCKTTSDRQLLLFTKKVFDCTSAQSIRFYLCLQENLTSHELQMLFKYRGIISYFFPHHAVFTFLRSLQDPKKRADMFSSEKALLTSILLSRYTDPDVVDVITTARYLKSFLHLGYRKGRSFDRWLDCDYDICSGLADKLVLLKPSALPKNRNDWNVLMKVLTLNLVHRHHGFNLDTIKSMNDLKKSLFGSTRPTAATIKSEYEGFLDYVTFIYDILIYSHLNLDELYGLTNNDPDIWPYLRHDKEHLRDAKTQMLYSYPVAAIKKDSDYWHEHIARINDTLVNLRERQRMELTQRFAPELLPNAANMQKPALLFKNKKFSIAGVNFTQLQEEYEFNQETRDLEHCVASYFDGADSGYYFIFSLESENERSTLQVTPIFTHEEKRIRLDLEFSQFYSFKNTKPCTKHQQAAEKFFSELHNTLAHDKSLIKSIYDFKQQRQESVDLRLSMLSRPYVDEFIRLFPALKSLKKIHRNHRD